MHDLRDKFASHAKIGKNKEREENEMKRKEKQGKEKEVGVGHNGHLISITKLN